MFKLIIFEREVVFMEVLNVIGVILLALCFVFFPLPLKARKRGFYTITTAIIYTLFLVLFIIALIVKGCN